MTKFMKFFQVTSNRNILISKTGNFRKFLCNYIQGLWYQSPKFTQVGPLSPLSVTILWGNRCSTWPPKRPLLCLEGGWAPSPCVQADPDQPLRNGYSQTLLKVKKSQASCTSQKCFWFFFWKNCPKMCLDDFQGFLAWLFTPSYNFCGFVFAARKRPRSILCLPLPASLHLCSQQKILAVNISNPCIPYLWHLKRCRKRVFSTVPFNLQCHPWTQMVVVSLASPIARGILAECIGIFLD